MPHQKTIRTYHPRMAELVSVLVVWPRWQDVDVVGVAVSLKRPESSSISSSIPRAVPGFG